MLIPQMIETARQLLPYTSEFDHDVIRVPVSTQQLLEIAISSPEQEDTVLLQKPFYEVEFRKCYVKSVAISWEFVKIY